MEGKVIRTAVVFFITLSLLLHVKVHTAFSQSSDLTFDKAFEDYLLSYEPYQQAHREYVVAKSAYLRFRTLKSRSDAREATLKMLQERDEVVIKYYISLRERVEENAGLTDNEKELLTILLNEHIEWFTEHKSRLVSAETPEDLATDSDTAKVKFEASKPLIYEVLARVAYGKLKDMRDRSVETFSTLKAKTEQIKNDDREGYALSSRKVQTIDRWLSESDSRIVRFDEKITAAQVLIDQINHKDTRNPLLVYNNSFVALEEARQYLKGSLSFMSEVIRELKIAEEQ